MKCKKCEKSGYVKGESEPQDERLCYILTNVTSGGIPEFDTWCLKCLEELKISLVNSEPIHK